MGVFITGFQRPRRVFNYYTSPFWGDGSDGVLSEGTIYQAGVDFDKYTGFCIKQFKEINWDPAESETITVDEPCRGLILFSQGDVYIGPNATVSVEKKGSILPCKPEEFLQFFNTGKQMRHIVDQLLTLKGGAGGNGGRGTSMEGGVSGTAGTGGVGRVCQGGFGGGGGGSGLGSGARGGNGGSILLPEVLGNGGFYEGAPGVQGGGGASVSTYANDNWHPGAYPCGAGAGGSTTSPSAIGEHTGGFILFIAKGNFYCRGTLNVSGGNGGNGGGGGGGGAGGGVIAVFAKGIIDSTGATKIMNGGQPGTSSGSAGTAGSDGTYYEERLI